jgi:ferredoxin
MSLQATAILVEDEAVLRTEFRVPADNLEQPVFVSGPLKQTGRVMAKDENVCLHCGLCAERCPTYAWDMRKFVLQIPYAGSRSTVIPLAAV